MLRQHGWNATSFQILEPGFLYWFDGPETCVAYIDTGRAWVAAGAPIGPAELVGGAAERFVAAAAAQKRRACFFGTEDRFASTTPFAAMRVGEQPVWDPREWEQTVAANASLRAQIRRAAAKEVEIRRFDPRLLAQAGDARREVDGLIARWQGAHPMPPMGFLVQMHLDSAIEERRFFGAYRSIGTGTLKGFPYPPATTPLSKAQLRQRDRRWSAFSAWCRCSRGAGGSSRTCCVRPTRPTAPPSCWSTPPCGPPPAKAART